MTSRPSSLQALPGGWSSWAFIQGTGQRATNDEHGECGDAPAHPRRHAPPAGDHAGSGRQGDQGEQYGSGIHGNRRCTATAPTTANTTTNQPIARTARMPAGRYGAFVMAS